MKTIWKYQILTTHIQDVILPANSEIICIQNQYETPCLWAIVNPKSDLFEQRKLIIFETGQEITDSERLKYIGTYQLMNGSLVYHVFEKLQL